MSGEGENEERQERKDLFLNFRFRFHSGGDVLGLGEVDRRRVGI